MWWNVTSSTCSKIYHSAALAQFTPVSDDCCSRPCIIEMTGYHRMQQSVTVHLAIQLIKALLGRKG